MNHPDTAPAFIVVRVLPRRGFVELLLRDTDTGALFYFLTNTP